MVGFVCGFKLRRDRVAARAEFAMAQRDQYAQTSALFLRARWCAVNLFAHTLYIEEVSEEVLAFAVAQRASIAISSL